MKGCDINHNENSAMVKSIKKGINLMKKAISIIISFIVLSASISVSSISAFAETTSEYWEPRPYYQDSLGYVNGEPGDGINVTYNSTEDAYTICYSGDGKLTGWEFPTAKENDDYKIISQDSNSITITILSDYGIPYINVLADFNEEPASESITNVSSQKIEQARADAEINEAAEKTFADQSNATTSFDEITSEKATNDAGTQFGLQNTNKIIGVFVIAAICSAAVIFFKKKRAK